MAHYRSRRRTVSKRSKAFRPFVCFLLIASFGILFAGCSSTASKNDEYVFTEQDAAKFHELATQVQNNGNGHIVATGSGQMSSGPYLEPLASASGALSSDIPVLDLSMVKTYNSIRTAGVNGGANMFRVTNEFLNVRSAPQSAASTVSTLHHGDMVEVLEFTNARFAKVKVGGGIGYVSGDYIAKVTSEDQLAAEKQKYEGQYFVNFAFVNLRKDKNAQSEKLGQIPGQAIITPKRIDGDWMFVGFK